MKEALLHIKELATIDADSLRREYESKLSHTRTPNATSYAALSGDLESRLVAICHYVDSMLKVYYPSVQEMADEFAKELKDALLHEEYHRIRCSLPSLDWYSGGTIAAQRTGDNGEDDVGFELVTKADSCVVDIAIQNRCGSYFVVYNGEVITDASELVDLLVSQGI